MLKTITVASGRRCEFIDITSMVEEVISASRVKGGVCRLFVPHTTAGITINENADPSVKADIINSLGASVPLNNNYKHSEGNSDAHIKSSLMGNEKTVFVEGGHLKLGTWQGIFFCEFDGPRNRSVWIMIEEIKNADKEI